jgi:hypothetical protein
MSTRAGAARVSAAPGRAYPGARPGANPGDSHRSGASHPLRAPGQAGRPPRPRVIHSRTSRTLRERLRLQGVRLAWVLIPLIALLLGGVVFVNVQRLNLTTQTGRTVDMYNQAQSDILRLRAVLAEKDGQVVEQAAKRLGMVLAPGSGLTYVSVPKEARIAPGQAPRTR